jgi:hypothetical protein
MFLPPQYFWLEPVLIAAAVVFIVDLISNAITFSNRFANALMSAIIFAALFGALSYYGYGSVRIQARTTPAVDAPVNQQPVPR